MLWVSVLLVLTQSTCWVASVMGPNTCSRQETYTVTMRVLEKRPVTTKTYTWCFNMPPRCTKYKQEMVDHYRVQTEPRTRWVNECCPGYRPDTAGIYCEPVCPLGCDHGSCTAPHMCSCHPGYYGISCDKVDCPEGRWGPGCALTCSCLNSASCHPETGKCLCRPGYWGTRCESICPSGTFGDRCEKECTCEDLVATCHHATGECYISSTSSPSKVKDNLSTTEGRPGILLEEVENSSSIDNSPDTMQRLVEGSSASGDTPLSEPLVTTSEDITSSELESEDHVASDGHKIPESSLLEKNIEIDGREAENISLEIKNNPETEIILDASSSAPSITWNPDIPLTSIISSNIDSNITSIRISTTTASPVSVDNSKDLKDITRFLEDESHEDQLEHGRAEHITDGPQISEEGSEEGETEETSERFTEASVNKDGSRSKTSQEGAIEETSVDFEGQILQIREMSTQGPYHQVQKVVDLSESDESSQTKTDEQRKKFTDLKKHKFKERSKDIANHKSDAGTHDHGWVIPEREPEESPKYEETTHRDHMEKIPDIGKPKKVSDQKKAKDVADVGQLKIAPNQERQQGDSKNSYNDFLSSFSIAAGVSTGVIMVAGLITLMARCRRAKPKNEPDVALEMDTVNNKQDNDRASVAVDEATLPVVRPLFFSPVYLPGDVSPTEGNGLILTAVFSRPATNIQDLYRQQDLLRETLAPHYDVPPPTGTRTSVCTSIGTAETEHVYEELPCYRNTSSHYESQC